MKIDKSQSSFEKTVLSALVQLQDDMSVVKTDLRRLEVLHEETDGEIQRIAEIVAPGMKEITKFREHEEQQDDTILFHERRIGFLEKKIA